MSKLSVSSGGRTDVVIVGAGQAGISLSYYLQQVGVDHIVLERDRPFSSWIQRWDGFKTNTPNWMNTLPMMPVGRFPSNDPRAFATRDEMVEYLEDCLEVVDPPIVTGAEVRRIVERGSGLWHVQTAGALYETRFVAICNGAMSRPRVPKPAADIPSSVPQLHSSDYRNPNQIQTRDVLVVGSASSGMQICRLLAESKRFRQIYLAESRVTVLPERIIGVQTHRFLHAFGLFDVRTRSALGRLMYSNLETKGDPIMPPAAEGLAELFGVRLMPKFADVAGTSLRFTDGQTLTTSDLSVVWCTGYEGSYDFIETRDSPGAFGESGYPNHVRGVVDAAPGLCFVGLRYQHTVASHDIYGVAKDAEFVADHIHRSLAEDGPRGVSAEFAREI